MSYTLVVEPSAARDIADSYAAKFSPMAITETGPSRSPKTVDGDHRKRFIAIGGPANCAVIT